MTLKEWKGQMAERFAGQFTILPGDGDAIRHKTLDDVDGTRCCPIIAFGFEDGMEFYDASNRCADTAGIGLGLDPNDVGLIMDASDYVEIPDAVPLRQWMLDVLVHGKAVAA